MSDDFLNDFPGLAGSAKEVFSRPRQEWLEETPAYNNGAEKKLLVWGPNQAVPARCYGNFNYGKDKYEIIVCRDPIRSKQKYGVEALIYNFGGGSSGGGGGGGGRGGGGGGGG